VEWAVWMGLWKSRAYLDAGLDSLCILAGNRQKGMAISHTPSSQPLVQELLMPLHRAGRGFIDSTRYTDLCWLGYL
jgi:hypothetical protein